ncbi:MAG: hypothetical protein EOO20_22510 [Chryseobacterium sp.]|nr:MAG: hypothetical protein EOO20_22510 [Chryseobacterium sp.]
MVEIEDQLIKNIKIMNETVWEQRVQQPTVESWLKNFEFLTEKHSDVKLYALYLLSRFLYFGDREIREMLKSLYRDKYKYSLVHEIRKSMSDTKDLTMINNEFNKKLRATRFLGVGNPSESGCHLLYYFRQENEIASDLFINAHEIFSRDDKGQVILGLEDVERYVFIDDFCGSGRQAVEYSNKLINDLKKIKPDAHTSYYVMFSTESGMKKVKNRTSFDSVDCVYELDESFKCFGEKSRYFSELDTTFKLELAKYICNVSGYQLCSSDPLGYGDCQLMIGFHHNTPDNTLPIFWSNGKPGFPWSPAFKRYDKN